MWTNSYGNCCAYNREFVRRCLNNSVLFNNTITIGFPAFVEGTFSMFNERT